MKYKTNSSTFTMQGRTMNCYWMNCGVFRAVEEVQLSANSEVFHFFCATFRAFRGQTYREKMTLLNQRWKNEESFRISKLVERTMFCLDWADWDASCETIEIYLTIDLYKLDDDVCLLVLTSSFVVSLLWWDKKW